jgi:hypothetical protein
MSKAAKLPPSAKPVKDLEAHEEAYSHFQGLLKTGMHTRDLDLWVRASAGRQNLFAGLAIGMIKWPKSLGRPNTPQLSGGFVFDTQFWVDIWHLGLDGSIVTDKNGWLRGDDPAVWDGPEEADHYSVKYLFYAADQNDNLLEVGFANVNWHTTGRRAGRNVRHYLSVPGWQFYCAGQFVGLPDITIASQPFFHR